MIIFGRLQVYYLLLLTLVMVFPRLTSKWKQRHLPQGWTEQRAVKWLQEVYLKSPIPIGSTYWFEWAPVTQVWFSSHLVSVRPGSKPWEKVWALQSQLKVGSTDICEVHICKKDDAERDWEGEGRCTDAGWWTHPVTARFLPFFAERASLTCPALPCPPCPGRGGSALPFYYRPASEACLIKRHFPPLLTTTPPSYISVQISVITQTIRMLKLDGCLGKVVFCPYF